MLCIVDMSVMNIIDTFVKCCSDFRSSSDSYCSNYQFRNNIYSKVINMLVLVPFSLFLGWALQSNRHLHPNDLDWEVTAVTLILKDNKQL